MIYRKTLWADGSRLLSFLERKVSVCEGSHFWEKPAGTIRWNANQNAEETDRTGNVHFEI